MLNNNKTGDTQLRKLTSASNRTQQRRKTTNLVR
jgi:hypothetical protein